jgi:hypothetical protein
MKNFLWFEVRNCTILTKNIPITEFLSKEKSAFNGSQPNFSANHIGNQDARKIRKSEIPMSVCAFLMNKNG